MTDLQTVDLHISYFCAVTSLILLKAENGAFGIVSGNLSAPGYPPRPKDRLEVIGEKASIILEGPTLELSGKTNEKVSYDLENAYQQSYDNAISHFVDSLKAETPFETDRLDNIETLRLVDNAYKLAGHSREKASPGL